MVVATTAQDIAVHRQSGAWRKLERIALDLVQDAQLHAKSKLTARLGGGTRLMLALNHRISHDIDLFIRDPQWLGYLTPRLNDRFEHLFDAYEEGSTSLKLRLPEGEIDFIVSMDLLDLPSEREVDCAFELEPVAEVLAKKLFYRGWSLTPRDLFDWWAIEHSAPHAIDKQTMAHLLKTKLKDIEAALDQTRQSHHIAAVWQAILAPERPALSAAIDWGKAQLALYQKWL